MYQQFEHRELPLNQPKLQHFSDALSFLMVGLENLASGATEPLKQEQFARELHTFWVHWQCSAQPSAENSSASIPMRKMQVRNFAVNSQILKSPFMLEALLKWHTRLQKTGTQEIMQLAPDFLSTVQAHLESHGLRAPIPEQETSYES
ncbi:MAG: hypothetical protein HC848_08475 [Limnobacter sp.]|nr:hypothetical protein [Limnobacter sp.]